MNNPGRILRSFLPLRSSTLPTTPIQDVTPINISLSTIQQGAIPESVRIQAELCPTAWAPAPVSSPCAPWVGGVSTIQQTPARGPIYVNVQTTSASSTTQRVREAVVSQATPYTQPILLPPPNMRSPNPAPAIASTTCEIRRYAGSEPPPT
jgi:hypothetical protein